MVRGKDALWGAFYGILFMISGVTLALLSIYVFEPALGLGRLANHHVGGEEAFWERISAVLIFLIYGFEDWILGALPFVLMYLGLLASGVRSPGIYCVFGALAFVICTVASDALKGERFFRILSQGNDIQSYWPGVLRLVAVGVVLGALLWLIDRGRLRRKEVGQ